MTTNTALFLNASYDFTDTLTGSVEGRYATDDVGAVLPLDGLELQTGYQINDNWSISGNVSLIRREFTNTTEAPAVTRVGLNVSLARDAWSAILYVDNLLDDRSMIPRGATSRNRFNQLNAPAVIPAEYQFAFQGGPWASFRFSPNEGRSFGFRLNYDF